MVWSVRYRQHMWLGAASLLVIAATLLYQSFGDALIGAVAGAATPSRTATELRLSVREFAFDPGTLRLSAGQSATLHFVNAGRIQHILVIPAADVRLPVDAGQSDSVEVGFTRPGTYTFSCEIPDHRDVGMTGRIIVSP